MRRLAMFATAVGLTVALAPPAQATAGDLDPTFDHDGRVVIDDLPSVNEFGGAIAPTLDGKLLIAVSGFEPDSAGIVRLNHDGSLDTAFGSGGVLAVPKLRSIGDMAVDRGGRITIVGPSVATGGVSVMRFLPEGVPDEVFHHGRTAIPVIDGERATHLAVPPNSGVGVAGTATSAAGHDSFFVAELTRRGRPRRSFSGNGRLRLEMGDGGGASGVAVQRNESVVVVGGALRQGRSYEAGVARVAPTGELDPTFGEGGRTFVDALDRPDVDVALRNGLILVAGTTEGKDGLRSAAVARLTADGAPDASFGRDGLAVHSMAQGQEHTTAMTLEGPKVLILGTCSSVLGRTDFCLMRLLAHGAVDTTFGGDGRVRTDFRDSEATIGDTDEAGDVAVQPNGRIVVSGGAAVDVQYVTALARYLNG